MTQAYPLQWPAGQPRTKDRTDSTFKVGHSRAFEEMVDELARFGARNVVISTNIPLRRDGSPYRDGLTDLMDDPGVAVYFTKGKRQIAIGVDAYRRPWENCRALGLSVKAFRDIERYGAQQVLDQAFTGFMALSAPDQVSEATNLAWWMILGVHPDATEAEIRAAYKAKVREAGGTSVELNAARDSGLMARGAA